MRLSRKQKILRNLLLVGLLWLFLAWTWDFPVLTERGILRRAEQIHLLSDSELVLSAGNIYGKTVYGRCGTNLLVVRTSTTPVGHRVVYPAIYREEDGICLLLRPDGEPGVELLAFGDIRSAVSAALEVTTENRENWEAEPVYETYLTQGTQIAPGAFLFRLQPHYESGNISFTAESEERFFSGEWYPRLLCTLRLYDESGALLHEKDVENPEDVTFSNWPEVSE